MNLMKRNRLKTNSKSFLGYNRKTIDNIQFCDFDYRGKKGVKR